MQREVAGCKLEIVMQAFISMSFIIYLWKLMISRLKKSVYWKDFSLQLQTVFEDNNLTPAVITPYSYPWEFVLF